MVNKVCGELAVPPVTSVVNDARGWPLLSLANRALEEVSQAYNWPYLLNTTPHTIATVVDQAEYSLPTDFWKLAVDTLYDTDSDYRLHGGMTLQQFQRATVHNSLLNRFGYRIHGYGTGRKIVLTPTPDAVVNLGLWYFTNEFAVDGGGTSKAAFTSDGDSSKVPERLIELELKWRYARQRGQDYAEEFREAQDAKAKAFAEALALPCIYLGCTNDSSPLTEGYVPDTGYGA